MSNDIQANQSAATVGLPATRPAQATKVEGQAGMEPKVADNRPAQREPRLDPKELRRQVQEATEQLNRQMEHNKRDLSFGVDDVANKIVVTVKNHKGELVRQIPSETALKVAHNLADVKGLMQDEKI